jgi:hypothetical protein
MNCSPELIPQNVIVDLHLGYDGIFEGRGSFEDGMADHHGAKKAALAASAQVKDTNLICTATLILPMVSRRVWLFAISPGINA